MKYVLFDLDGTLTDPKEGITKCVQYALFHFGIDEPCLDNLEKFIGPPLDESFSEFYGFDTEKAWQAIEKYRERFADVGKFENKVFDGIPDMLASLKENGCMLAVATSKPEFFAAEILEKFGLAEYFDCIKGAALDGTKSVKKDIIKLVIDEMGINDLSLAVMVGDRLHDIVGAHEVGMKCVGVRFGYAEEGELERYGADYIADTVEDLGRLLLRL
ncbi:MAG: HAD family hydrolase [Oscillospiraceae bacterium]